MGKQQTTTAGIDSYQRITDRILTDLEQGVTPWTKPWSAGTLGARVTRPLRVTGKPYTGINVILLWMEAVANGYAVPTWMTYKQAQALGGQVRRGEHGRQIRHHHQAGRRRRGGRGRGRPENPVPEDLSVFNVVQIEGLPARFHPEPEALSPAPSTAERIEATGARVAHGGNHAFYKISEDRIQLPPFEAFHDAHGYYATCRHETVHWTRHPSRLDRSFGRERWGDEGYAREELVAELGTAFLAADLGLALEPRADHAAYIGHWITVLRNDKRAIVSAALHAERAVKYLHALQPAEQLEAA